MFSHSNKSKYVSNSLFLLTSYPSSSIGPLSRAYFEHMAADLGDEWRQLVDYLGVTPARIQSMCTEHQDSGSTIKVIQEALVWWYKQSTRNSDKVSRTVFSFYPLPYIS